jgi:hypothetical protein
MVHLTEIKFWIPFKIWSQVEHRFWVELISHTESLLPISEARWKHQHVSVSRALQRSAKTTWYAGQKKKRIESSYFSQEKDLSHVRVEISTNSEGSQNMIASSERASQTSLWFRSNCSFSS